MKELHINLEKYHFFWYDLIEQPFQPAEYFEENTKQWITKKLGEIKSSNDKFIYFICSREKIRFDSSKKVKYSFFSKRKIKVPLLLENCKKDIIVEFIHPKNQKCNFDITNGKFITITDESGNKETIDIHNFLKKSKVDLGFASKVEYVGYTKNPDSRPTNGAHSGLNKILYNFLISENSKDIFFYFNEFIARDNALQKFTFPDLEKKLIEKSFIFYFDSLNQNENRDNEKKELINILDKMKKLGFASIFFDYEFAVRDGYSKFYSDKINPSHVHNFSIYSDDKNELKINRGLSSIFSDINAKNIHNEDWIETKIVPKDAL